MNTPISFSAAIFDLDGTLLSTLEELAAACNAALARLQLPTHEVDAYRHFVGAGAKTLAWRVLPQEHKTPEIHEALYAALLEEYQNFINTLSHPYAGIPESLARLTSAGKKVAVLSNKPDALTKLAVQKFLPSITFSAIQGGKDTVPLKPEPESALGLAKQMNESPENIIFVGDSDIDMQTANNAGMIAVGAVWGFRGAKELTEAGAKILLDTPEELGKLV